MAEKNSLWKNKIKIKAQYADGGYMYPDGGTVLNKDGLLIAPTLPEFEVVSEAPQWLKYKNEYEQKNPKSTSINKYLTPFARGLGNDEHNYPKRLDDEYNTDLYNSYTDKLLNDFSFEFTDKEQELVDRYAKTERDKSAYKYFKDKKQDKKWQDEYLEAVKDVTVDTFKDQLPDIASKYSSNPYVAKLLKLPHLNKIEAGRQFFWEGRPLTALSELIKIPKIPKISSITADALLNTAQENPTGYDLATLENKYLSPVRLGAGKNDQIISNIGKEILESGETKDSNWKSRKYNLPSLTEASKNFEKKYGVSQNDFVEFIENYMVGRDKTYKETLDAYDRYLQAQPNQKAQGGYMYYAGGPVEYKVGGKVWQGIGNTAYGLLEGTLNTVTGGLTAPIMNMGQEALQKAANKNFDPTNPDDVKAMRQINTAGGAGEIAGSWLGLTLNPANVGSAVAGTASGANTIIGSSTASDDVKQWSQGISGLAQFGHMMNGSAGNGSSGSTDGGSSGEGASGFGDILTNFSGTEFGKSAQKVMPFANQAAGMFGDSKGSLLEQGYAAQKRLNSPEYLAMQEMQNQQYVNQGLSFAAQGGHINNEKYLVNSQTTMKGRYSNHKNRYAKGGTFNQYGIDMIPDSAGLHHESAYGGVPIGPNALAEGGEIIMDNPDGTKYVVSGPVDGTKSQMDFTFSKGGKYKELDRTLAEGMEQDLSKYSMGDLATNPKNKEDLRRPNDSHAQSTIDQIKQKWQQKTEFARQRNQQEQAIAQAQQQKQLIEEEYIAAYGGKINPKKYPGLNMPKKAKGGYVYNAMTQPMLAHGGPMVSNVQQPFNGPAAQNRGGMMMANGGIMYAQGGPGDELDPEKLKAEGFVEYNTYFYNPKSGRYIDKPSDFSQEDAMYQKNIEKFMEPGTQFDERTINPLTNLTANSRIEQLPIDLGMTTLSGGVKKPGMEDVIGPDSYVEGTRSITPRLRFNSSPEEYSGKYNLQYVDPYTLGGNEMLDARYPILDRDNNIQLTPDEFDKLQTLGSRSDIRSKYFNENYNQIQSTRDKVKKAYQSNFSEVIPTGLDSKGNYIFGKPEQPANQQVKPTQPSNTYLRNLNTPNFVDNQGNTSSILSRIENRDTPQPIQPIQSKPFYFSKDDTTPGLVGKVSNTPPYDTSGFIPTDVIANKNANKTAIVEDNYGPIIPNNTIPKENAKTLEGLTSPQTYPDLLPPQGPYNPYGEYGFYGKDADGNDVSINPNMTNQYQTGQFTPEGYTPSPNKGFFSKAADMLKGKSGADALVAAGQLAGPIHQLLQKKPKPFQYKKASATTVDPTAAIILSNEEQRRAQDTAGYNIKQNAPTSGSYLSNMRALGLGAGKQRGSTAAGIRQQYDVNNADTLNQFEQFNTGIENANIDAMQQDQANFQEQRTNALYNAGANIAGMRKDYKTNEINQIIANNIGTNNWKYDPVNQTITYRASNGEMVTAPAASIVGTNPTNLGTGEMQQPGTPQFQNSFNSRLNQGFRDRFKGINSGK